MPNANSIWMEAAKEEDIVTICTSNQFPNLLKKICLLKCISSTQNIDKRKKNRVIVKMIEGTGGEKIPEDKEIAIVEIEETKIEIIVIEIEIKEEIVTVIEKEKEINKNIRRDPNQDKDLEITSIKTKRSVNAQNLQVTGILWTEDS